MGIGTKSGIIALAGNAFSNIYSLDVDGVDDYVTMGDTLDFDYNDAFSFSFWLNRATSSDTTCILSRADKASPFSGYIILVQDNKTYFRLRNNSSNNFFIKGTVNIPNNTWTHYVVTYDGSNNVNGMTLYKNGASETVTTTSTGTVSSFASLSLPFNLATRDNLPNIAYNGNMDEVAVFNSELSASDVLSIYNGNGAGKPGDLSSFNPLSWWRFEEGSGTTVKDSGTGGNNGTINGGATYQTDVPS